MNHFQPEYIDSGHIRKFINKKENIVRKHFHQPTQFTIHLYDRRNAVNLIRVISKAEVRILPGTVKFIPSQRQLQRW